MGLMRRCGFWVFPDNSHFTGNFAETGSVQSIRNKENPLKPEAWWSNSLLTGTGNFLTGTGNGPKLSGSPRPRSGKLSDSEAEAPFLLGPLERQSLADKSFEA